MSQVWLITGANRGLGAAIARAALDAGHIVVAAARNPDSIKSTLDAGEDRLRSIAIDVTEPLSTVDAAAFAVSAFGRIDVLVNNAGIGGVNKPTPPATRGATGIRSTPPPSSPSRGSPNHCRKNWPSSASS